MCLSETCFVTLALMDRVAGAGLSGAKEAPGFRASALQPRPPELQGTKHNSTRRVKLRCRSMFYDRHIFTRDLADCLTRDAAQHPDTRR